MRVDYEQLSHLHGRLIELLAWLESSTGLEFTNTSNYRPGDDGVHGTIPLRGWDLRMRSKPVGFAIAQHINQAWEYDPQRLGMYCAILHGEGTNLHLHIQVHDNTRMK